MVLALRVESHIIRTSLRRQSHLSSPVLNQSSRTRIIVEAGCTIRLGGGVLAHSPAPREELEPAEADRKAKPRSEPEDAPAFIV